MTVHIYHRLSLVLVMTAGFGLYAEDASQVTGLQARHYAGQTFVTWKEIQPPATDEKLSYSKLNEMKLALGVPGKITYVLYRSDKPITSLDGLKPIGTTGQLSCWDQSFNGYGDPKETDLVNRFIIEDGKPPLSAGTALYVHNPRTEKTAQAAMTGKPVSEGAKLKGYYAATAVIDGKENKALSLANCLKDPVDEVEGQGVPVLQRKESPKEFTFVADPTLEYYVRWEAPPNANHENFPIDVLIAIPKGMTEPVAVGLHLHCWGGNINSGYGWWYNAEKGALLVATNENPYDWWTGYHELLNQVPANQEAWSKGVVRPYSQRRLLSLLDWVKTTWKVDENRVFVGGNSMGGSGTCMLAIRHPERFAWAIGWVGVHIPAKTPTFAESYAGVYGLKEWNVKFEDGTPVWDYFSDVWYLRQYPERETPFITFSNGKNDGAIGWPQAQEFYKALQETKRPHLFNWGQAGHSQRAVMPVSLEQRDNPLDIRIDQSLPAFTKGSLDNNPGNGDPNDGDPEGGVNLYLTWETKDIVDEPGVWEMTVGLTDKAPKDDCTVDLTPRRLQKFKVKAGDKVTWTNTSAGKVIKSGAVTADTHGLLTIEGLQVSKVGNRVKITK